MELRLILRETNPNVSFYDGITLTEYEQLSNRWEEILSIVHKEISNYVNDNTLCFEDSFPNKNKLTGKYYIDEIFYIKYPNGFKIMIKTRLTEYILNAEDDYLELDVTLFTMSFQDKFEVWGIDSSSI